MQEFIFEQNSRFDPYAEIKAAKTLDELFGVILQAFGTSLVKQEQEEEKISGYYEKLVRGDFNSDPYTQFWSKFELATKEVGDLGKTMKSMSIYLKLHQKNLANAA